ncbi:autophagy-related protein 13b [Typha angustifolia]|uniref:autophagy-related protein 13b n=1 Tax=Typha angustifolia TaxID=59011 RepID=UPI003C2E3244
MASSPCNSPFAPPIIEQVITEFFAKSLHIILESRSPYVSSRNYSVDHFTSSPSSSCSPSPSSSRPRDKWFNLALRDCPAALENCDLWRQSNLEPLVIDIVLMRKMLTSSTPGSSHGGYLIRNLSGKDCYLNRSSGPAGPFPESEGEKIVERWIVQYESQNSSSFGREAYQGSRKSSYGSSHSSEIPNLYKKTYSRLIVLLRSLYVVVRLLPAYKLFCELNSSGRIHPLRLSHRINSFIKPFTRAENAEFNCFGFVPIDTPFGRLSLSVSYLPTLEDVNSEPSTPLSTQFIMDYVGSPTTDPLKRFQSLPSAELAPACISVARRHSWSIDHGAIPSVSLSPSPGYSDSRVFHCNRTSYLPPRSPMHDHSLSPSSLPTTASTVHKKNTSFDEYWSLSPSTSPSPPAHFSGGNVLNSLFRSESAPIGITSSRPDRNSALPPHPSPKCAKQSCSLKADNLRTQVPTASPDCKLQSKNEFLSLGESQSSKALQKVFYFGKDDIGNLPDWRASCSSPRIPSWNSSRLYDDFDDSESSYPFVEDGRDRIEISRGKCQEGSNAESEGSFAVKSSPDAIVGAVVQMLKTAPPLRQELSYSVRSSQGLKGEALGQSIKNGEDMEVRTKELISHASSSAIAASGLSKSRTTADALKDLLRYKEMKDALLQRGGSQSLNINSKERSSGEEGDS